MKWTLLIVDSNGQSRRFPFDLGRQWVAGRYENSVDAVNRAASEGSRDPLVLDETKYLPLECDHRINRWHCLFEHENEVATVQDLASRDGTYLNGASISGKQSLRHGDVVRVANCQIFVDCTAPPSPKAF